MKLTILTAVAVLLAACGVAEGTFDEGATAATNAGLSWDEFTTKYAVYELDTGVWVADGDTAFFSQKQLREFYEANVQAGQLIVNRVGSADDVWSATQKLNLTYCVSNTFNGNKAAMVTAMAQSTQAWMNVANVRFVYVPAQDGSCTASNKNVLFNVRPVNVNGQYLARSFFPSTARSGREVLVDGTSFSGQGVSLVGVLRHELGHTLGFRHEHTRPEAGTCFEDNSWRALTTYDSASVMHYPQCNGTGDFADLSLTALDAKGASDLYGAPGGGVPTPPPAPTTTTQTFSGTLAKGASKTLPVFQVTPGETFTVTMTGTGDADLYVRFGAAPTATKYSCRPYLDGSAESCTLTVPAATSAAYVKVVGYVASSWSLSVEH
jgi:hypothetical protein